MRLLYDVKSFLISKMSNITSLKDKFKKIHNDYNIRFKKFSKMLNTTFQEDLDDGELNDIVEWFTEYKKMMEYSKQTLDDFETEIKNKRLRLTPERVKENEIFDEVKDKIMPIAIVYWLALTAQ